MRVLISQVKAVPSARFGFIPRCVPWEVTLQQNPDTTIEQVINIAVSGNFLYGYPTADGTLTFFPASSELEDSPVPVLAIAVIFAGVLDETKILKEIITEADWLWLQETHGVTRAHLGIT